MKPITPKPITPLNAIIPSVIETSPRGKRALDILSMLRSELLVFLATQFDPQTVTRMIAHLHFLA